jgi:hypothetical protein
MIDHEAIVTQSILGVPSPLMHRPARAEGNWNGRWYGVFEFEGYTEDAAGGVGLERRGHCRARSGAGSSAVCFMLKNAAGAQAVIPQLMQKRTPLLGQKTL